MVTNSYETRLALHMKNCIDDIIYKAKTPFWLNKLISPHNMLAILMTELQCVFTFPVDFGPFQMQK